MLSDISANYLAPIIVFKFCTGTCGSYSPSFSIYASAQKSKLTCERDMAHKALAHSSESYMEKTSDVAVMAIFAKKIVGKRA